ncbi:MAG: hypothetical protein KBC81_00040 [Candidatus Pacebacteria bacterium]|nr:hypothetical protein [Candidatus Paceibacterota bacterium]
MGKALGFLFAFVVLAFTVVGINDRQEWVKSLGHETTYHFGPAMFINIDITVGRDDKSELIEIARYGRTKSYLLSEIKGRLLIKSTELSGDGQAASYWDDYDKLDAFDRDLIDSARAKVTKKRAKNAEA